MNWSLFRSRTFWTVFAMFLIGGINAVVNLLPSELQAVVMAILSVAATYFHVNPSQQYNR